MPPRFITLAIVAFWLATTAWFCYAEVWPRLRPGERPPFTIDLAYEVTSESEPCRWTVFHNGQTVGQARTWVSYQRSDDTYELNSKFWFDAGASRSDEKPPELAFSFLNGLVKVKVEHMKSSYRVTRDGDLRTLDGEVVAAVQSPVAEQVKVIVHGKVENGVLTPLWQAEYHGVPYKRTTEPVEVASNHSFLNPLQPWNRLLDVREKQRWQIQLFDPLTESVSASIGSFVPQASLPKVELLDAGVLEGTQDYTWRNREVPCLVIEYRGQTDFIARTWVRQSDGLVLRQEAVRSEGNLDEERLALERIR